MTATASLVVESKPPVDRLLEVRTPFGRPAGWADIAMVTDIGDTHELNDDRCLVLTSNDLGERAPPPFRDFMLCLLADGATGSTFGRELEPGASADPPRHAGWRASQLAQAVFVERFLSSHEIDIMDRLKDGLRAADRALVDSGEGRLSTTLTALFLASDGTACAASIGDSVLLVLPPRRRTPAERRLKKLGYEDTTAVGSGDTTLSSVQESDLIEQWWPNKEGGATGTTVQPGTYLVLMSDGISDNLPAEYIDQLLHRNALESATVAMVHETRARRARTQKQGGGSLSELGLDNMSAIVVRYNGARRWQRPAGVARLDDATLMCVMGARGGATSSSGGQFAVACLAGQERGATAMPGFLRSFIESEDQADRSERLSTALLMAMPKRGQARFAALSVDERGERRHLSSGGVDVGLVPVEINERRVAAAHETAWQKFLYTPRLWASTLATVALLALVSTAFATGTVRPAPPAAATPAPGEPTPTPDTRPAISFGGFQLVAPAAPATPTPTPNLAQSPVELNAEILPSEQRPPEPPPPTQQTCANLLGIGCTRPPPPPAPPRTVPQPVQPPEQAPESCGNFLGIGCTQPQSPPPDILPAPSPAPRAANQERALGLKPISPPPGSKLDDALHIASVADQNFQRGVNAGADPQNSVDGPGEP